MSLNHGINTYKSDTSFSTIAEGTVGIPFYVGCWPAHTAEGFTGRPQIAYSFDEAKKSGGYSYEWRDETGSPKWSLCQAMYAHFKIFGMAPAVFYNVFDPTKNKEAVEETSFTVTDHIVKLPFDAILDEALIVLNNESNNLEKNKDFEAYYDDDNCIIELLPTGTHYEDSILKISYNKASLKDINSESIELAIEKIEDCKALFGIVPDLICCPGWSQTPSVAAIMAAKAASINGVFKGKAVVDLDTSSSGADEYSDVLNYKSAKGYTDENMIVCWPLVQIDDYLFDYSVIICGHISALDSANDNVPYESPSNKTVPITGCVNKSGGEITLSVQQADAVSFTAGVVTAINYNGWRVWGNYTGCNPGSTDVAKYFICTNRMMDFICNTFVNTFWDYVDRPLTRVLIDAIVNSFNTYLAGLVHDGKLYGGEIQFVTENNQTSELLAGRFRLDTSIASPVPAQQIDMFVEFDVDTLVNSLNI